MKIVLQRVTNAKVTVDGELVSSIGRGLCLLVGICSTDTIKDIEFMANKILNIKIFDDEKSKRWSKSVSDKQLEILCVSQFTLYNTWKGNRPDFHNAMSGNKAKELYEEFLQLLKIKYGPDKIKDGQFGAYMQVSIQNDGPVTFQIESPAPAQRLAKGERTRGRGDDIDKQDNQMATPAPGQRSAKAVTNCLATDLEKEATQEVGTCNRDDDALTPRTETDFAEADTKV